MRARSATALVKPSVALATQMAAVHNAAMIAACRLNHSKGVSLAELIAQQDSASNAFNKLTRTFAAQLEALRRYRSGNEATVKTQNVTVNDGGPGHCRKCPQWGRR